MAEAQAETVTKSKTEYTAVQMKDGREVRFAGKRKVDKNMIIDESKIAIEGDTIQMQAGAVGIRMDFRNGDTRTFYPPLSLYAQFLGHGGEQKYGDELATTADKPLSEEDMVLAVDDLDAVIQKGSWGRGRASGGGSVSGASIVVQAILEATNARNAAKGKPPTTLEAIKAYIQGKLEKDPELTRRALYDSFRVAGTETGIIIKRLEEAKLAKTARVDANAELDTIGE